MWERERGGGCGPRGMRDGEEIEGVGSRERDEVGNLIKSETKFLSPGW